MTNILESTSRIWEKVSVSNNAKNKWENEVVYMMNINSILMYQSLRKCVKKGIYKEWIKRLFTKNE